MALEQKHLNVSTRAEGYMDVMMYIPDDSIVIQNVSSNDVLEYSDINSIADIRNYTSTTIATLEENLWILNGSFINPTAGRKYNGYISNSMSDAEGVFEVNPTIDIQLLTSSYIEYFTLILNPAIKTGYPKQIKLTCFDVAGQIIGKEVIRNIEEETALPNLQYELKLNDVSKLTLEFIGTVTPYRRMRISSVMFGKVLTLDQNEIISADYTDKCSYVPDSIPSRTFSFDLNNYSKKYNIDNPDNGYVDLDRRTKVMMRNGYNIAGYIEDENGNGYINNPDKRKEIEWDDWKEFHLLNVSTTDEDTCTIECGSILDMMTDVYSGERFVNNRTVRQIVDNLLAFMALSGATVVFEDDGTGKSYGDYIINTVLPEIPVRELIQLLAFSVGATLMIEDNGIIKFKHLELLDPNTYNHVHSFTFKDFVSTPSAQQLENTDHISLPKYNSIVKDEEEEITTINVSAYQVEVSYSDCVPTGAYKAADDTSGGSVQAYDLYAHKGTLTVNIPEAGVSTKVVIVGYPIETTQTQERSVTKDTLIIDTQLMSYDENDSIKNKYKEWYSKKFKYTMDTRGEPLVDAGDFCYIETPFSGVTNLHASFVLQNHVTFDGAWSGDMEVIVL